MQPQQGGVELLQNAAATSGPSSSSSAAAAAATSMATAGASAAPTTSSAAAASTANNNNAVPQLNLDHYKYLRTLLPTIPHVIESLCVSDANSWECTVYAALLSESDCLKWLIEFQDNTKTDWRPEDERKVAISDGTGVVVSNSTLVYRCVGSAYQDVGGEELRKKCPAKMDMKILTPAEVEKSGRGKQYPCLVHISFYHNHPLSTSIGGGLLTSSVVPATAGVTPTADFKLTELGTSALKDQFEYFLPNNNLGEAAHQAVSLSAIQPQQTPSQQQQQQQQPQQADPNHQQHQSQALTVQTVQILPSYQSAVLDLNDVSRKLDEALDTLRTMLKKSGTSSVVVKQFADNFEALKGDEAALENALCNFGIGSTATTITASQIQPPPPPPLPPAPASSAPVASLGTEASATTTLNLGGQPVQLTPLPQASSTSLLQTATELISTSSANTTSLTTLTTPQWSMTPVLSSQPPKEVQPTAAAPAVHTPVAAEAAAGDSQLGAVGAAVSDAVAKTLKKLKNKRRKPKSNSSVLPGQIDPLTGKRRKRSRCGTCLGCINRDKTQDCRVCRNCLDQKRYGGPGRLKKACVKRSCEIMATTEGLEPVPSKRSTSSSTSGGGAAKSQQQQQQPAATLGGTTIALPMHPLPVATAAETSGTVTLPQQPVTLAARTTSAGTLLASTQTPSIAASSSAAASTAVSGTAAAPSTSNSTAAPAAVLSWPNGTDFPPTFQVQQPVQFTYQSQGDDAFAPISAVTAAVSAAPASVLSAATSGTADPDDTDSQASADTLVDQFVSSAVGNGGGGTSTIQLDDIASEAARHHGIS